MVGGVPPQSRKKAEPARARLPWGSAALPRAAGVAGAPAGRGAPLRPLQPPGGRGSRAERERERERESCRRAPAARTFMLPLAIDFFFFAGCASPSQLSLELAFPLAIAPLGSSLSLSLPLSLLSLSSQRRQSSAGTRLPAAPVPAAQCPRRSRSRSRRESGILPGCHLPGEEEADERAGAIYRHPKAQGKGELLWHLIPASALLFPLTESLALLWQCGKYIYFFFFSPSPTPPANG